MSTRHQQAIEDLQEACEARGIGPRALALLLELEFGENVSPASTAMLKTLMEKVRAFDAGFRATLARLENLGDDEGYAPARRVLESIVESDRVEAPLGTVPRPILESLANPKAVPEAEPLEDPELGRLDREHAEMCEDVESFSVRELRAAKANLGGSGPIPDALRLLLDHAIEADEDLNRFQDRLEAIEEAGSSTITVAESAIPRSLSSMEERLLAGQAQDRAIRKAIGAKAGEYTIDEVRRVLDTARSNAESAEAAHMSAEQNVQIEIKRREKAKRALGEMQQERAQLVDMLRAEDDPPDERWCIDSLYDAIRDLDKSEKSLRDSRAKSISSLEEVKEDSSHPSGSIRISVRLGAPAVAKLDDRLASGLYGLDRLETIVRMIERGVEATEPGARR